MKGLVIDMPWIEYLLDGSKTWEMRSQAAAYRGWVALIAKGTGKVVGAGRLVRVGAPLDEKGMIANIDKHRIPEAMIRSGMVDRWVVPWMFEDVTRLPNPVRYDHPSGAVTWVNLYDSVVAAVERQIPRASPADASAALQFVPSEPVVINKVEPPSVLVSGRGNVIGRARITQGNLGNNHFYMRDFLNRFPADAIGGSNKESAGRPVLVDWGSGVPVETDIDGEKKFFRARGWIRKLFERSGAEAGHHVVVAETGPRSYRVWVEG